MGLLGSTPTVRGFKGVGFNRALPAPFNFDLCWKGDGTNDHFTIPYQVGKQIGSVFTIEFWMKYENTNPFSVFSLRNDAGNDKITIHFNNNNLYVGWQSVGQSGTAHGMTLGNTYHWVFNFNISTNKVDVYRNGIFLIQFSTSLAIWNISVFYVGAGFGIGSILLDAYMNNKLDEFRIYNKALAQYQITAHYNTGIGANTSETEFLKYWYQFEKFETLDFSLAQDGSDMRTGIKDVSGNANHLLQVNQDTNPASGTYVLKTF